MWNIAIANNLVTSLGTKPSGSVMDMLKRSGPVTTVDLIIILIFSIISWAVIFNKFRLLRSTKKNSQKFYKAYDINKKEKLSKLYAMVRNTGESHVSNIFKAGYQDLVEHHRMKNSQDVATAAENSIDNLRKKDEHLHILQRALSRALSDEITKLDRGLAFLATTGSTCPFLGLFGTIWGVMNAFGAIGLSAGTPSLSSIAPGISEALITTAAGLVAAIPAAVCYNILNSSIKFLITDMENFSMDFLSLVERKL